MIKTRVRYLFFEHWSGRKKTSVRFVYRSEGEGKHDRNIINAVSQNNLYYCILVLRRVKNPYRDITVCYLFEYLLLLFYGLWKWIICILGPSSTVIYVHKILELIRIYIPYSIGFLDVFVVAVSDFIQSFGFRPV